MGELTQEEIDQIVGSVKLKNITGNDLRIEGFNGFTFTPDQMVEMVKDHSGAVEGAPRASDYHIAMSMLKSSNQELCQMVAMGQLSLETIEPDHTVLDEEGGR